MVNRIPINFVDDESKESHSNRRGDDELPEINVDNMVVDDAAFEVEVEIVGDENMQDSNGHHSSEDVSNSLADALSKAISATTAYESGDNAPQNSKELRGSYEKLRAELYATRAELRRVEIELEKSNEATKTAAVEKQAVLDQLMRLQADYENFRKRIERGRGETYNRLVGDVVGHLLPVMDNLRRAIEAEASIEATESAEFRHFLHGVGLIAKQLGGVLESLGVETIATVGKLFDPHIHEAIAIEPSAAVEADTVLQEIVSGYRLGDKLLRPASVKVATKPD